MIILYYLPRFHFYLRFSFFYCCLLFYPFLTLQTFSKCQPFNPCSPQNQSQTSFQILVTTDNRLNFFCLLLLWWLHPPNSIFATQKNSNPLWEPKLHYIVFSRWIPFLLYLLLFFLLCALCVLLCFHYMRIHFLILIFKSVFYLFFLYKDSDFTTNMFFNFKLIFLFWVVLSCCFNFLFILFGCNGMVTLSIVSCLFTMIINNSVA